MLRLAMTGLAGLAMGLQAPMLAAQAAPQARAASAITGTVVDGSAGTPVPGAIVQLTWLAGATTGRQLRQVADEQGRFAFLNLPGDSFYVIATTKHGYLEGGHGRETGPTDELRSIRIGTDEWVSNLRVPIWKPATISGIVRDEAGDPVVGVFVRALVRFRIQGRDELAAGPMTVTDDRGAYRLAGLAPGRYVIQVPSVQASMPAGATHRIVPSADPEAVVEVDDTQRLVVSRFPLPPPPRNGRAMTYSMAFHPAATVVRQALTIEVAYGEERSGVDVVLTPVPAVRVSGTVVAPPEALEFLTVRLLPAGMESLGQGAEAATAFVANDGQFTFLNVPSGMYTVDAPIRHSEFIVTTPGRLYFSLPPGRYGWNRETDSIDGFPGLQLMSTDFRGGAGTGYSGRTSLTVGNADVGNLVVQLKPTATMRGRIVAELGVTRSVLPPPVPSALIILDPAGGEASLGAPRPRVITTLPVVGETNSSRGGPGEFHIAGIAPGKYWIRLRNSEQARLGSAFSPPRDPPIWRIKSVVWKGRDHSIEPLDIAEGDALADVIVTVTNSAGELTGTVQGSGAVSRDRAMVVAFPAESAEWRNAGLWPARMKAASVSSTGTYRFSTLPAGTYYVAAIDRSYKTTWQDAALLAQVARSAVRVTLTWGGSMTQDLTTVAVR